MESKKEEVKKESSKEETPKGETPKDKTPNGETPAAPESSLVGLPSKEYTLKDSSKDEFNLKVYQGKNSIIFHARILKDLSETLYNEETDFEEFCNLNQFFKKFSSIAEIFAILFENVKKNEIIVKKAEKRVNLTVKFETGGKFEEINFFLKPEKADIDNIALNLCIKVIEIDEKLKEDDKKLDNIKEEIKEIKSEMKEGREESSKNQKEMKDILHLIKKSLAIGSQIIKYNEFKFIESAIRKNLGKNVKYYKLIYRGSRNGFRAEDFHEKCDGKTNTIVFVQAKNGRRFGGFSEAKWDKSDSYKNSPNGFLFSLDNKEVFYNKKNECDIYCCGEKGPIFGDGHDLFIDDNCNRTNDNCDNTNHSYDTLGKEYALAGTKYFYVEDYEVYQLDLE